MSKNILKASVASLQSSPVGNFYLHPEVLKTRQEKNTNSLEFTMGKYGQQQPVTAVERNGRLLIIDGWGRKTAAEKMGIDNLLYIIREIPDDEVIQQRMFLNQRSKKSTIETCLELEYILDVLGKSQGKKRELLGFHNFDSDDEYGKVGKDRFDLAAAIAGVEIKSSTLRKLMYVFWSEYPKPKEERCGAWELFDKDQISAHKAYKLVKSKEEKEEKKANRNPLRVVHSNMNEGECPYQLYNKSCFIMDEISDNSVDVAIDSHPYALSQRDYRNQDSMLHGQEPTVEEYLKNFKSFNNEKFKKLKPGGVLATIIGESYRDGYQGVCSRAEIVLQEIGFKILDVVIWVKSNQKYTPHPYRFQNSYERIIVAYKPGAEPYFQDVLRTGSVKGFKAKKTKSGGYYMASPETCITNVITTSVFNPVEFKDIDPEFQHDAPCPTALYKILIQAYSKPGDTILDGFVGSGTVGIGLTMGRKVIGFDVDHESIEFCRKRFEWFLQQGTENDVQNDLLIAA